NDFTNLTFSNVALGNATSTAGWTGLFVDGAPQTPTAGYALDPSPPSTLTLAGVTVTGPPGTFTAFTTPVLVNGPPTADDITGTDGKDIILALPGADEIHAAGGNDVVIAGDGADEIHGG